MFTSARKITCCIAFVIVGIAVAAPPSTNLPNGFGRCRLSDPSVNKCLKEQLTRDYPLLVKGIPSLGIPQMDPLRITKLDMTIGVGSVSVNIKLREFDIKNLRSTVITDFVYDPKNHTIKFDLLAKKPIILEGHYEANGKVIILPIVGNGTFKYILTDFKAFVYVYLKPNIKNGKTYMKVDNYSWKYTISKLNIRLDNLFNGDKTLGDNMNVFLNENWGVLQEEVQPSFQNAFGMAFAAIGQEFLNRVSLNEIFLD